MITFKPMLTISILMLFLSSCNNEELFYAQTDELIVEDVPIVDNPNPEDVLTVLLGDDSYTTLQGVPVVMAPYTNDENIPSAFIFNATSPVSGTVTIDDNATPTNFLDDVITYSPNADFSGVDSFDYTICDTTNPDNCDTAIVTITVDPIVDDIASELKAFPSAYGAGAYTTGGQGLGVFHVTSLNNSGAGSLRQAVADASSAGGGNIIFDISGVIQLTSILSFTSNLTIAGQTAPEGGITIDGERVFVLDTNNLIVRHIRFKGGNDGGDDSVTIRGNVTNQIWDHCSFSFGADEAASWYETQSGKTVDNISIQRCLFSENSKGSIVGGGTGTTTTGDISFNFNLFYNNSHRFPNSSGDNANVEVINNVVWGVTSRLVRVNGNGHNLNHIGNYYDFGTRGMVDDRLHMYSYETGYPNIYTSGNKIVAQSPSTPLTSTASQMNTDNKLAWKHFIDATSTPQGTRNKGNQLEDEYFIDTQHALLGSAVTILTADQALVNVSADVGCNARLNSDGTVSSNLDVLDDNALKQVLQGNYLDKLEKSQYIVPSITSVIRPAGYDTDGDGMPNDWETANGFDPNTPDGSGDIDNDGYTNLEEFLNIVDK